MTNTKHNSFTKKALSLVLTVVMAFGYAGLLSGVIGGDLFGTKLEAHAADANSYDSLKTAINNANNASGTTTIRLTADISGGSVAALPAINKNVILDLNGKSISWSYTGSMGRGDSSGTYQLPSENQGTNDREVDYLDKAMFNVGTSGSLQIINTSSTNSTVKVNTQLTRNSGQAISGNTGTVHGTASSNLIYSQGTVILGDKSNSGYNNFTLNATAIATNSGNSTLDRHNYHAHALAFTVTVNNSNAKLFMYGGTVEAEGKSRCFYDGRNHMRVYALNIQNAYSAEIYGGTAKINSARIECETSTDCDGDQCWASAIRCNTPNVYIFNVNCTASGGSGNDTSAASLELSNVLACASPGPLIYGGKFTSTSEKGGSDAGSVHNHTIQSKSGAGWRLAIDGNIAPSNGFPCVNDNGTWVIGDARYQEGANTLTDVFYTIFHFADTDTENGVYPWNYTTFRDYIGAHTAGNDAYFASSASHWNDNNNYSAATAGNYYRNGYRHTGWKGATTPVSCDSASTSMTSTSAAGYNATNGGSLFLYPTWTEATYNINYDLNQGTGAVVPTNNGAPTTYTINSTSALPRPTRNGYYFKGWYLTKKAYDKIGGDFIESSTDNPTTLDMSQSYDSVDPWTLDYSYNPKWNGSAYTAGQPLNGKNGHIWLKAIWEEIPYTATFDWNDKVAGDPSANTVTSGDYKVNLNPTFTFPSVDTNLKPYYTSNHKWKVTGADGSWTNTTTEYADNSGPSAGSYGNPTFTAQYTPIQYDINFAPMGGSTITPNYTTTATNIYHYTYESTDELPTCTRLGYTLAGWKPTETVREDWDSTKIVWDETYTYPAGTSVEHKHGNVTLEAQWTSVKSNVYLNANGGSYSGGSPLTYTFHSGLAITNVPKKDGYTFAGWKVTQIPNYGDDTNTYPNANRWVMDTVYHEDQNHPGTYSLDTRKLGDVTLTAQWTPNQYELKYDSAGGTSCSTIPAYTIEDTLTLATTTRKGYQFTGWVPSLTDPNAADDTYNWNAASYGAGQQVTGRFGNVTLTAGWNINTYTITFDANCDGELANPASIQYTVEQGVDLSGIQASMVRDAYTFDYWEVDTSNLANPSTWLDDPNAGRTYTDWIPSGVYGNVKLIAHWTPTEFTVRLDDGSGVNGVINYNIASPAFALGGATMSGYTFSHWKVNANAGSWVKDDTYDADDQISGMWGNVTLSAVYVADEYTITYLDKDGNEIASFGDGVTYTSDYTIQDDITLPPYSVDGYEFGGWEVASVGDVSSGWNRGDDMPVGGYTAGQYFGDVTLTPILTPIGYTVSFVTGQGSPVPDLPYDIEGTDTLPVPTRNGYNFSGWQVNETRGNWIAGDVIPGGTAVTGRWGSPTLTALWTAKSIPVKYIVGNTTLWPDGIIKNGTFNETAPDLTDDQKAKPADAQYTYTFDHWEPALGKIERETPEYVYTAVYTQELNSYDVEWYLPSDVGGNPGNYTLKKTTTVDYGTAPDYGGVPSMDSASQTYFWTFEGWATSAGGDPIEAPLPNVEGPGVKYYAVFTKELTPINVTWVINGEAHTGDKCGVGKIPSWKGATPTKPDADGYEYVFDGWDPEPVVVNEGDPDRTYTAVFHPVLKTYTITLKLNGGEMSDPQTIDYRMGDTVTFPAPVKAGYRFTGWLLDAAVGTWAAGTTVPAGDFTTNTLWGAASFTAQWEPVAYTIRFAPASAEDTVPADMTYTIEDTAALPAADASREGYTLKEWIVSVADGNWTQGTTVLKDYQLSGNYGNVTLTPVWTVNTYTITWNSYNYTQYSEVEYDSAIMAYTPVSRMGYTGEWDAEVPASMPAHDLEFNAVYTAVEYYIRLNSNGGSEVENFYYTIDGNNTLPVPTRDGATFIGWKVVAAQGNWSRNTVVPGGPEHSLNGKYGNVSLTAQWNLRTHTVSWRLDTGDLIRESVWFYGATPSYDGAPYKAPDEHNSYRFIGWAASEHGEILDTLPAVIADVSYYAQFEEIERTYIVRWIVDNQEVLRQTECAYGDATEFTGETPQKESTSQYDYTFAGWATAVNGDPLEELPPVTADATYYAVFDRFTKLQRITLDLSSKDLELDENYQLNVTLTPADATVRDVNWISLRPDVATVDANGKVTAVTPGFAVIKASSGDGSKNAFCVISVRPRNTKVVTVTAGGVSTTQLAGAMLQLSATVAPDNATNTGIVWSTGDPAVATVDQSGLVKFVDVGETDITALASDGFSVGSIHVVTTVDETEVEDNVKTYLITFGEFAPGFRLDENGDVYKSGRMFVAEGETVRFRLAVDNSRQGLYTVYTNSSVIRYGDDYWYTLENVHNNMVIRFAEGAPGIGTPEEDEGGNSGSQMGFFQRIAAFFRKIVEFFRSIFNR